MKKALLSTTFAFLTSSLLFAPEGKSTGFAACGDVSLNDTVIVANNTVTGGCSITPDVYEIVIYEMGLCTGVGNPVGTTLNRTNCTSTFLNANGQTVDLAGSASITLNAENSTTPPPNTYTWGYMVMGNTFGLSGSVVTAQNTWRSTSDGSATNNAVSNVKFTETLSSFAQNCTPNMTAGQMTAIVADSALRQVDGITCANAARIVGAFSPPNPFVITESTSALKITFDVSASATQEGAMAVIPNAPNIGGVWRFGGGAFAMEITTVD